MFPRITRWTLNSRPQPLIRSRLFTQASGVAKRHTHCLGLGMKIPAVFLPRIPGTLQNINTFFFQRQRKTKV